jgi:hypothetical protein
VGVRTRGGGGVACSLDCCSHQDQNTTAPRSRADTVVIAASFTFSSPLLVSRSVALQGDVASCGGAWCTLSGGAATRLFVVSAPTPVTLSLASLSLVNASDACDGPLAPQGGAAVLLLGQGAGASVASPTLLVSACVLAGNAATGAAPGGAVSASPAATWNGTGVTALGTPLHALAANVSISDTLFSWNTAAAAAGALYAHGPTALSNVSFTSNGALFAAASLTSTSTLSWLGSSPALTGSFGLGLAGALQQGAGNLSAVGCAFTGNAGTQGGALVCGAGCSCALASCSFVNNSALGTALTGGNTVLGSGGAVAALTGAALSLADSVLVNNSCSADGGAVYASGTKVAAINERLAPYYGGETAIVAAPVLVMLTGCTLSGNAAAVSGGGVYVDGANATVVLASSSFAGCAAGKKGGGVYAASGSNATLTGVSVSGCVAGTAGGGIAVGSGANLSLAAGCVLSSCSAPMGTGGGLYADARASIVLSGGVAISGNAALSGGALYVDAGGALTASDASISANAAGMGGGVFLSPAASASLLRCALTGNSVNVSGAALFATSAAAVSLASCTLANNSATGFAPHGGAASFENVDDVTVTACRFSFNAVTVVSAQASPVGQVDPIVYAGAFSGGALFLASGDAAAGGSASISDTQFFGCSAAGVGGALSVLAQAAPLALSVLRCSFASHAAGDSGGAVALSGAVAASFTDTRFTGCVASSGDGGAYAVLDGDSGALASGNATMSVLQNASFTGNVAPTGRGGALFLSGGAAAATTLSGGAMLQNSALYGGAIGLAATHALTAGSASLSSNNGTHGGGVFALFDAPSLALAALSMTGNFAPIGALFFADAPVEPPACASCVLTGNVALNYGGVALNNSIGIATDPVSFSLTATEVQPNEPFTLRMAMRDAYGSAVAQWPGFAAAVASAASLSGVLDVGAYSNFGAALTTARIDGAPLDTIPLVVTVTSPLLNAPTAALDITLAACPADESFSASSGQCLCRRGFFRQPGSTAPCAPCAAGSFAAGVGEVACAPCAQGAVSAAGASACAVCPLFSAPLSASVCVCDVDFFGVFASLSNGTCAACPADAVCRGGMLVPAPGAWLSLAPGASPQQCMQSAACDWPGRTAALLALSRNGSVSDDARRDAQCAPGYTGPLCGQCTDGYGHDASDLLCAACPSPLANTGKLVATSLASVASLIVTIRANLKVDKPGTPRHAAIIKIFLSYLTVTSMASRAPLTWPPRIAELLGAQAVMSHSGGKAVPLECSLPRRGHPKFYDVVLGYLVMVPCAAMAAPTLIWLLIFVLHARPAAARTARRRRFDALWREVQGPDFAWAPAPLLARSLQVDGAAPLGLLDRAFEKLLDAQLPSEGDAIDDVRRVARKCANGAVVSLIIVVFYLWTPLTSTVLTLFTCIGIDAGVPASPFHGSFLKQDTTERCWVGRHLAYTLGIGVAGLGIIVIGVPLGSAVFLWRARARIHHDAELRSRFSFLYEGYKTHVCYYESIVLMRKLALVAVTTFFPRAAPTSGAYVMAVMLGVMLASFWTHMKLQPYTAAALDQLELLSMGGSIITFWLGLLLTLPTPRGVRVAFTVALALFNAFLCAQFVLTILRELVRSRMERRRPAGARQDATADDAREADAEDTAPLVDFFSFTFWPEIEARPDGASKRLRAWAALHFIASLEQRRRSIAQLRVDVPRAALRVALANARDELERRAESCARWVAAGVVSDDATAAWLAGYESCGREPATLAPLVALSAARQAAHAAFQAVAAGRDGGAAFEASARASSSFADLVARHQAGQRSKRMSRRRVPPPPSLRKRIDFALTFTAAEAPGEEAASELPAVAAPAPAPPWPPPRSAAVRAASPLLRATSPTTRQRQPTPSRGVDDGQLQQRLAADVFDYDARADV